MKSIDIILLLSLSLVSDSLVFTIYDKIFLLNLFFYKCETQFKL